MEDYDETSAFSSPLGRRVGYGTTPTTNLRPAAPAPRPPSARIVHHVQPSDTIQGIALKYNVTVEELRRVNKLWASDSIWLRGTLLIPAQSAIDGEAGDNGSNTAGIASAVAASPDMPAPLASTGNSSSGADFLSRMDSSLLAAKSHLQTITAAESAVSQLAYSAGKPVAEQKQQPFAMLEGAANVTDWRGSSSSLTFRGSSSSTMRDLHDTPEPVVRTSSAQDRMERLQDELFQL